ncbi:hypothetical protein ACHHYP_08779 [Achlya hypogyna]|uniref:Uncharacterized protein n=1 Tax=Achlya hypogyna TaxID=1202772 RepID=A0A1V9ZK68_ACHHY|nr:hypothetical protein ACHHYP_08779 [Achlya hypogyna]
MMTRQPSEARSSAAADKLRKREYHREKQRMYRQEEANELNFLRGRVRDLEAEVARLSQRKALTTLSWREVASALGEEKRSVVHQRRLLQSQRKMYQDLALRMTTWVDQHTGRVKKPLDTSGGSWRNTTLLKEPESRKLGVDWITKQMFFNVDRVLRDCEFPAPSEGSFLNDFTIRELENDTFQYVWRQMTLVPFGLPFTLSILRRVIHQYITGAIWSPGNGKLLDQELLEGVGPNVQYARTVVSDAEAVNLIAREFAVGDDRVVVVSQNIHDDETLPECQRQCDRRFWVVLDKVSENETKISLLYINSHFFTKAGFVSLAVEAACWGCPNLSTDATEAQQTRQFKRHADAVGQQFLEFNRQMPYHVMGSLGM